MKLPKAALTAFAMATGALGACSTPSTITGHYEPCPTGVSCPNIDGLPERSVTRQVIPRGPQQGFVCSQQDRAFVDAVGVMRVVRTKWGGIPWMYNAEDPTDDGRVKREGNWQFCDQSPNMGSWDHDAAAVFIYVQNGVIVGSKARKDFGKRSPAVDIEYRVPVAESLAANDVAACSAEEAFDTVRKGGLPQTVPTELLKKANNQYFTGMALKL